MDHRLPLSDIQSQVQCKTLVRTCQITMAISATGPINEHLNSIMKNISEILKGHRGTIGCDHEQALILSSMQGGGISSI